MEETHVITGEQIPKYRMSVLKYALYLELKGMKRRGRSAYSIIKEEFKLHGTRQEVYDKFSKMVEDMKNGHV